LEKIMPWWPGWHSIESTEFWNIFFFWFGIGCLLLLGISEVVSHYYGQRHNALVDAAESVAAAQRRDEQRQVEERHRAEMAQVQRRLEEARKEQAPRRLTPDQQATLIAALSPFRGQKITIWFVMGNTESKDFASDFDSVIRRAGWDDGGGVNQATYGGPDPVGVEVFVKEATPDNEPPALVGLVVTLAKMGLMPGRNVDVDADLPIDTIKLSIGAKPTTPR
jgi:hypothetical protein